VTPLTIANVKPDMALPELRFDVTATRLISGALASRDFSPLHHDKNYVVDVVGQRNIFANTQFQAALFERYLNDWSGPLGRVVRMRFAMKSSIFAGDIVLIAGTVNEVRTSCECGAAVDLTIKMLVGEGLVTACDVLYALPAVEGDNPWHRCGKNWLQT